MTRPNDSRLLRALWTYARPHSLLFFFAVLCAPLSTILVVFQPIILQRAIDDFIVVGDEAGIVSMALAYLGIVLGAFLFEAAYTLFISYGAMRTIADLRTKVYSHTLRMPQAAFDRQPTGRLLTRATSDVEALGETLTAGAVTIVLDVLIVAGVIIGMFSMNVGLTLVLLLVVPVLAVVVNALRKVLRRLYVHVRTSLATLNAYMAERLTGVEVVQLYRDEARTMEAFNRRLLDYRDTTIRTNVWDALLFAVVDGLSSVTMALMLWYGANGIFEGVLTAGVLAAFIDYVAKLFGPIQQFSQKLAVIQQAMSALEKITGLLAQPTFQRESDLRIPVGENVGLEMGDVWFAYSEEGPDVLRGVSLSVKPGQVVALVGRTGSGKSTIGKVVSSAYSGYRGTINLGGRELEQLDLRNAREIVGTVRQDVHLLPGTIRSNLLLGKEIPDDRLNEAVELASAGPLVARLGGLDGVLEEGGKNISRGEAQLLSFARVILSNSPFVVLDEATASVDSMTEAAIQSATAALLSRKTVLVIAHRLSTISHADRIVVMDQGQIVEQGSHQELIANGGQYAKLYEQQLLGEQQSHV